LALRMVNYMKKVSEKCRHCYSKTIEPLPETQLNVTRLMGPTITWLCAQLFLILSFFIFKSLLIIKDLLAHFCCYFFIKSVILQICFLNFSYFFGLLFSRHNIITNISFSIIFIYMGENHCLSA